ncbi:MAG: hypothetical protein HYV68_03490 [Candidatus Taylorbacteria bacterium]|nr:hypothetical protein [Candidatus Taylorbacteria bacterium]
MKKFVTILATATALLPISVALADTDWSSIVISNSNYAEVANVVEISASTGGNTSMGGSAATVVSATGDENSNGDNSSSGGTGGEITTGDAEVIVDIANLLGSNDTTAISPSEADASEVVVANANEAALANVVAAAVETGFNDTTAGSAATVLAADGEDSYNGGNSASGGMGGSITTGMTSLSVSIANLLGSNITRVNHHPEE